MVSKLLYRLSGYLPCRLIRLDSGPYLERYYLGQAAGVTFYLHRFVSSDPERHLHNHPWGWGRALVLTGGYLEDSVVDLCAHMMPSGCITIQKRVRRWNRVDGSLFHRISDAELETWTLFFHGPRVRLPGGQFKGWGFLERVETGTLFTPYMASSGRHVHEWWRGALKGRFAGREKFGGRQNAN